MIVKITLKSGTRVELDESWNGGKWEMKEFNFS